MDKLMKVEITKEIKKILENIFEQNQEVWVSGDQLSATFSCFSKSWLKTYGQSLPRTRAIVTDANGVQHEGPWTYPLHQIQKLMQNNEVKNLKIK